MPRTKSGLLAGARQFFRDCQEWGWIPRRFDPARALATPRSIRALIGPDPRVIADDVWAKLLWAGPQPGAQRRLRQPCRPQAPIELLRALALTWLFGGLRSDEIVRLRVGCIRWQREDVALPGDTDETLGKDAVCLLDVPVHKTGDRLHQTGRPDRGAGHRRLGGRPADPARRPRPQDQRTGAPAVLLPGARIGRQYLNIRVIPALCAKAGVPTADVRGNITSHRARSTIASQLYNAKEPMTLFELQAGSVTEVLPRPSITPRSPRPRWRRHTATPGTSPATSAPSKSWSTATPSPPGPRQRASPGNTTTSATATAPTASSSNVHTEWPAPVAISTPQRTPARHNCWRPRKTSSACWPASRSPTTNRQQSTTDRPPLTACWND